MKSIRTKRSQLSGMALGGLGTGSVELFPDGRLDRWQICNLGKWAACSPEKAHLEDLPDFGEGALRFYLRVVGKDGVPMVRKLSYSSQTGGFRSVMYSWMKEIEEIRWTPDFPLAALAYREREIPLSIQATYASPFVPLDCRVSGTPGFYVTFRLRNPTTEAWEVSLAGLLKNPVNRGRAQRNLHNRVLQEDGYTILTMESLSDGAEPQNGSIGFGVSGGRQSFLQGCWEAFLDSYVCNGPLGATEESCLFGFREKGEFPNSGWEERPGWFLRLEEEEVDRLPAAQIGRIIDFLRQSAEGASCWDRLKRLDPSPLETQEGKKEYIKQLLRRFRRFEADSGENGSVWGGGGLCTKVCLEPGEEKEIRFVVGWYFPNHISPSGRRVGHRYAEWFANAQEVCVFLLQKEKQILPRVYAFSRLLKKTTAPETYPRSWTAHLNTLIKCSWWAESGDFGIWEGYGSCGFHTMDITYHGSWGLLALFPELQLSQMEMGARFQRQDGRVHHFFTPDFQAVDEGFDRVDMNPQFVLLVCRDYLWTGDRRYLERMWPHIRLAMESTAALDTDGDGLPDGDTAANTYDAWGFQGTPSYISILWLAALEAGIRLAAEMQETKLQEKWQIMLQTGRESLLRLWNGSYFSLWLDGGKRDECCMTDQLDGQWYARLLGLPDFVEEGMARRALHSILSCNWRGEGGLINASYPPGSQPTLYTYQNVQAQANWSGIEYAFAGLLLACGMAEESHKVTEAVEERYIRAGRIFNHEECGEYYYRPLSSWTLLLSLTGFRLDVPRRRICIAPAYPNLAAPWFTPFAYGSMHLRQEEWKMACAEGSFLVEEIEIKAERQPVSVFLGKEKQAFVQNENRIRLEQPCLIKPGRILYIHFSD